MENKDSGIKTISKLLEEVAQEICDSYCKYPDTCETEEELYSKCDYCPLVTKL